MSDQEDIAAIAEAAGLGPRLHGVPAVLTGKYQIVGIDLKSAPSVCQDLAATIPTPSGYVLAPFSRGQGLRIGVFGKA